MHALIVDFLKNMWHCTKLVVIGQFQAAKAF